MSADGCLRCPDDARTRLFQEGYANLAHPELNPGIFSMGSRLERIALYATKVKDGY
ncbi:hypothetical protein GCM10010981_11790 [Dyella nitratireducens]|uniref:Uncharacterized protein n=1 Tax=Dyella nitratireducens TaxID=1849580 RepID=A0ABQ1FP73_9GAMM|nr:hypothetical protein GCM10010981_11790 [Dyella nitratireducens]GLQ43759.1 hypothetical protein GCM10007902_36090 [Dyella nitratireducens]